MFESDTDTEVIPKLMKYLYDTQVIALHKSEKLLSENLFASFILCDVI